MAGDVSEPPKRNRLFGIDLAAVREALDAMAEVEKRIPLGAWILPAVLVGIGVVAVAVIAWLR